MANDHFGYIGNRRIPYPNREYIESFENLAGGMNTMIRPVQLGGNESPFMKNLSWRNGALGSRRGQANKYQFTSGYEATFQTCAPFLFHGWLLVQGTWYATPIDNPPYTQSFIRAVKLRLEGVENEAALYSNALLILEAEDWSEHDGVFFRYRDDVFFKNKGNYIKIIWQGNTSNVDVVTATSLDPFIPTLQIDTVPLTGAGSEYQPINRLTTYRRIFYSGDGTAVYTLPESNVVSTATTIKVAGTTIPAAQYSVDEQTGAITFATGHEPPVGDDNVEIVYAVRDATSRNTLMDSSVAIVFGGTQELCVVMGGPDAQPNAYFWSGNNGVVMDPTYFPMNHYNLAGEVNAPITCFGKQQNMLVIFQPNAVGRAVFGIETIGGSSEETGKATITMNYTRINAEIGCDLPGSLQLVENNLVWCNRKYGVCRLKDSSAAYENNIVVLSRKINNKGESGFPGLLDEFKPGADGVVAPVDYSARSVDTGTRYVLRTSNGHAYEWNYEISEWGNPSWFFHTAIGGVGFVPLENDTLYEVTQDGVVAEFQDGVFYDKLGQTETPIDKVFWFPPRFLGGYDRLKNIMSAIFNTKSETDQNTTITYICDYRHRTDPTNIKVTAPTNAPMGQPYAHISRRKPGYHNIRHLQMGLSNNEAGKDMNILSAYIYYTYRGRQR